MAAKLYHFREMWDAEPKHFADIDGDALEIEGQRVAVDGLVFTRKGLLAAVNEEVAEATYLFMLRQWFTKVEGNMPRNFRVWLETDAWVKQRVSTVFKIPMQAFFIFDLMQSSDSSDDPMDLRLTRREAALTLTSGPRYRELALPVLSGLN